MSKAYDDSSIRTMTGTQHYRAKASMYGFQVSNLNGLYLMFKEVIDNSADESAAMDRNTIYPIDVTIFVAKDKSTYQCLVRDRGRGIPVGRIVDCLATANTSGKYDLDSYGAASTGTNGVGSKVVSALSKKFVAFTKRMDGFASLAIEKGEITHTWSTRKPIDKDRSTCGTTVLFQPDPEIMQVIGEMFNPKATPNGFEQWLDIMNDYALFHRNSLVRISIVDGLLKPGDLDISDGKSIKVWKYLTNLDNFKLEPKFESDLKTTPREYIIKKFGLKSPIWELGVPLVKEPDLKNADDRLSYDIDIFLDDKALKGENGIIGAVNATPINDQNSIHFTMLQNVIKMYLEGYFVDKEKATFFETKYVIPFDGYVSVGWLGAGFDGQDKSKFTDTTFGDFYRSHLRRQLKQLPESVWERLYELIEENFEKAYAKYSSSQYKINKNLKGIGYTLNRTGSYVPCKSSDSSIIELFITEGDSAAGRVKTVRNENIQAMFKLSGKPINAERADAKKLVKNAIYQDLMELIGVKPTDKNLDNMRFSKIIILTDADADGYHICALLIGIFKSINPLILEDGRIYMANPPLYSFRIQNQKRPLYLRDASALMALKTEIYRRMMDIYIQFGNAKEKPLTGSEYGALCAVVEHIGDTVTYVADQLNIEPFVLEQLLHCVDYLGEDSVNTEKIQKILKDAGVDHVLWDKTVNTITLVTQGLDRVISLSHLQAMLKSQVLPLYEKYNWKKLNLFVSTRHTDLYVHAPCSFMMLYTIFKTITNTDNSNHFALTRFKGLGEMSEEDIYGTCVDPITRCVSRIVGIGDVNTIYNMLGVDSEARKQLTNESVHGRLVNNGFLDE